MTGGLLWCRGLKIWHSGCCCGMGSIPGQGISICCGYSQKQKLKQKTNKQKKKQKNPLVTSLCSGIPDSEVLGWCLGMCIYHKSADDPAAAVHRQILRNIAPSRLGLWPTFQHPLGKDRGRDSPHCVICPCPKFLGIKWKSSQINSHVLSSFLFCFLILFIDLFIYFAF